MKYYERYKLEDFLLDERFRLWAVQPDTASDDFWMELGRHYPDKKIVMQQARELLLTWNQTRSELSDNDLEIQVTRILDSTETSSKRPYAFTFTRTWISIAALFIIIIGLAWTVSWKMKRVQPVSDYRQYVSETTVPMKEVVNKSGRKMNVHLPEA